ncbi:hypothetical protein [Geminicoccus flavidas]|uniref:hypothetical protein n=1 Tax=Geminicoccus flavidas TaxID=2506407 RepID=UPI00135B23F0|nr:hypothetical protein [Geminicoccus flavidas]
MAGTTRRHLLLATTALGLVGVTRPGHAATRIKLRDIYGRGAAFSEEALALADRPVQIQGFMAPPLKPDASFFVLTKMPMAVCPFCDKEADWPQDIVLVRLRRQQDWVNFNLPILVTGTLSLGTEVDEETGFVSRVRLIDAAYERL